MTFMFLYLSPYIKIVDIKIDKILLTFIEIVYDRHISLLFYYIEGYEIRDLL